MSATSPKGSVGSGKKGMKNSCDLSSDDDVDEEDIDEEEDDVNCSHRRSRKESNVSSNQMDS